MSEPNIREPATAEHAVPEPLQTHIAEARWFGGKGRGATVASVRRVGHLPGSAEGHDVVIDLARIDYPDAEPDFYQLPLAFYATAQSHLDHAHIGEWEDSELGHRHVYDAVHDRESMRLWLEAFDQASEAGQVARGELAFHRVPGHDLDLDTHSTLFSGEQSNSSVAYGEDSLMKVFRKVTPGVNPDISIHHVLTETGCEHVASLYGWLDLVDDETNSTIQLAMLQQFLRTASDGWDLALASVRNLFAEADLHADEVGGDFAGEAARLGAALGHVHATLREHFPVGDRPADELSRLMHQRLDEALGAVSQLGAFESTLRTAFDAVAGLGSIATQQVHGDLHLGQTLRTVKGWKIVDFEGEPAKTLAERMLPDSPWRDVAGMLRSFDYAPRVVALTSYASEPADQAEQQAYRAGEWAERNRAAFLAAYLDGRELTADEATLLQAYVADKAVYEALYEARNRPTWLSIPLAALVRMEA